MNIKKNRMFVITFCMAASFIINLSVRNADSKIVTNLPADVSGVETRALVVEDFENLKTVKKVEEDGWFATSEPKEYLKGDDEAKKKKNPVMALDLKSVDGGPNDMKVEEAYSDRSGKREEKNARPAFQVQISG